MTSSLRWWRRIGRPFNARDNRRFSKLQIWQFGSRSGRNFWRACGRQRKRPSCSIHSIASIRLLAGCLKKQGDDPVDELLKKILASGSRDRLLDCVRRAGLMDALLKDLAAWQYTLPPPLEKLYQALLKQALSIFEKDPARNLPFETRLEAAEALGRAGDPRLAENKEKDRWVGVKSGEFWMGAQKTDPNGRNYDPLAYEDEAPRRVKVAPFSMDRYPVTVAEYERLLSQILESNTYGTMVLSVGTIALLSARPTASRVAGRT